jgi:hypothetical protein
MDWLMSKGVWMGKGRLGGFSLKGRVPNLFVSYSIERDRSGDEELNEITCA